jgi:hypothetical protein
LIIEKDENRIKISPYGLLLPRFLVVGQSG